MGSVRLALGPIGAQEPAPPVRGWGTASLTQRGTPLQQPALLELHARHRPPNISDVSGEQRQERGT